MHPHKKLIYSLGLKDPVNETWLGSEPYCETENIVINQFDFLVVRYIWAFPEAGRDLDIQVQFENNSTPSVDNNFVGYGRNATVPQSTIPPQSAYLWWAHDDTNSSGNATGIEAVLVNMKKFRDDFPGSPNIITVALYAVWYASVATGDFVLEVKTYKGGSMEQTGTNIINSGGEMVSSDVKNLNTLISNRDVNPASSYKIGTLQYDKSTDTATLILS